MKTHSLGYVWSILDLLRTSWKLLCIKRGSTGARGARSETMSKKSFHHPLLNDVFWDRFGTILASFLESVFGLISGIVLGPFLVVVGSRLGSKFESKW